MNFGTFVYACCAILSIACAVLLLRAFGRGRERLLLWSGVCFAGLALNNVLLFLDVRVFPDVDLSLVRSIPAVAGILALVYSLVWDTR